MTATESQGKQRHFYFALGRKYYWLKYKLAENGLLSLLCLGT